jgi:pyridoxine 5-phosphate synthase
VDRIRLGVNVDHVASLRQARGTKYPDPLLAAAMAELGGADQVTIHLREDRRHIQERDLRLLRDTLTTALNLEMAEAEDVVALACEVRPDMATLVPERRQELTTEGGLKVVGREAELEKTVRRLKDAGIRVSLFIDPEPEAVHAAKALGVDQVEIHTGFYADARGAARGDELIRIAAAAAEGGRLELAVAAGHGLDYVNVRDVCAVPEIEELNIGHSIVARALFVGFEAAVREMADVIRSET